MTSKKFGVNLSNYQNLQVITSKTPEGLLAQLEQVRIRFQIVSIYAQSGTHFAWINPQRKIKIEKQIKKGVKNASS